MIKQESFDKDWIKAFNDKPQKANPQIIEKEIYALKLLELLAETKLEFVFKGGTCLSLLLQRFTRFSVDIDISTNTDPTLIPSFIQKIVDVGFFVDVIEQIRREQKDLKKAHYKFYYRSVITYEVDYVLLDIVFEENVFKDLEQHKIDFLLLKTEEPYLSVFTPSLEEMLIDKLTAFAPTSIGITYESGKITEIIKQMYDVSIISQNVDYSKIQHKLYHEIATKQIKRRSLEVTPMQTLTDTIETAINILTKGGISQENYSKLQESINGFSGYVYGRRFTGADADACAVDAIVVATIVLMEGYDNYQEAISKQVSENISALFRTEYRNLRGNLSRTGHFNKLIDSLSVISIKAIF